MSTFVKKPCPICGKIHKNRRCCCRECANIWRKDHPTNREQHVYDEMKVSPDTLLMIATDLDRKKSFEWIASRLYWSKEKLIAVIKYAEKNGLMKKYRTRIRDNATDKFIRGTSEVFYGVKMNDLNLSNIGGEII